ncbi:malonate decarboxylase acyl carrier protein [Limnobacter humi]|uniref:Malonate decarboxylase acyl carrier protein n=1 Tax=Limnobacter humi TaxID=1778671 RepID=A0ABT1WCH9_9BURK|nr:malonate decarboxylase acyl carrier protein [Limnobacter humi]MCQ8895210.1 malonate decarboxylase acyl carrier protein [Limnobacter humi]
MGHAVGVEHLNFSFAGTQAFQPKPDALVGVVGSGNLEVLVEPCENTHCEFNIHTSARGFAHIWEAVCRDFHRKHPLKGVRISIHDMGATPAVVSLRLEQALAEAGA